MATNFEEIGIELVLDGLLEFVKGMQVVDDAVDKFRESGEEVEETFKSTNSVMSGFVGWLAQVAAVAAGIVIANTFGRIADAIGNMARAAFESAAEFQGLIIRLEGLIATDLVSQSGGVLDFRDALEQAIPKARDLFFWVEQLALQSPFDITDVANVVTLAQAYGFGTERAKELTSAIVDFSSGMGLEGIHIQRIVENLGQMEQQGKVTGTELRDLGRGSFVPINDILTLMQETLGVTSERFLELKRDGLLPVSLFIDSFIELVGERFPNAGQRASRTITAVIGNLKDLIQGVLGFNVVRPILDSISGRMAEILDTLTTGVLGDRLLFVTEQIGLALKGIVDLFLGLGASPDALAENIVSTLEILAGKLIGIREIMNSVFAGDATAGQGLSAILQLIGVPDETIAAITNFAEAIGTLIENVRNFDSQEAFGEFIERVQVVLANFKTFWDTNGPAIIEAFDRLLGAILGTGEVGAETLLGVVLGQLDRVFTKIEEFSESAAGEGGADFTQSFIDFVDFVVEDFLPALEDVFGFVEENQDALVTIGLVLLAFSELGPAIGIIGAASILLTPILFNLSLIIMDIGSLLMGWLLTLNPLSLALIALGLVIAIFGEDAKKNWDNLVVLWTIMWKAIFEKADEAKDIFFQKWRDFRDAGAVWIVKLGKGISDSWTTLVNTTIPSLMGLLLFKINSFSSVMSSIAVNLVLGLWDGFRDKWNWFLTNIGNLFWQFQDFIKGLLGISSPSKVFAELGKQTMEGFAMGIMDAINLPKGAMTLAVNHMIAPVSQIAAASTGAGGAQSTQNFNLTIHSSARTEQVENDFRMLESLAVLDA